MIRSFIVESTCNNMRIDRWLRNKLGKVPQSLIEKSLRLGKIKINKKKIKSSFKIKTNDKIELFNIDFKETNFRIKVLRIVATIPFGKTASYKQIAEKIKNPKSVRAVGSANANNPIPIIIPCHRIISNDGKIGGYNGGVYLKNWLPEHESYHLLHSD